MDEPYDPGHAGEPAINPAPFVIAVVVFVVVAVLAFVFLREDGSERLLRPDAFDVVGEETLETTIGGGDGCVELLRAQVDTSDDDRVFVELVVEDTECEAGGDDGRLVTIVLPEPIDDRRVLGGVGRVELPCDPSGTCQADN